MGKRDVGKRGLSEREGDGRRERERKGRERREAVLGALGAFRALKPRTLENSHNCEKQKKLVARAQNSPLPGRAGTDLQDDSKQRKNMIGPTAL